MGFGVLVRSQAASKACIIPDTLKFEYKLAYLASSRIRLISISHLILFSSHISLIIRLPPF